MENVKTSSQLVHDWQQLIKVVRAQSVTPLLRVFMKFELYQDICL